MAFTFAVIPARGGSKGLPDKNIRLLGDTPLIGWTLRAAQQSRLLTQCIVSTDDERIVRVARKLGGDVPFIRPSELAADGSNIVEVVQHAVRWLEHSHNAKPDVIVLLQPTSPFRRPEDIEECVQLLFDTGADSVQTVTEDRRHPFHRFLMRDGRLKPLHNDSKRYGRRQEAPPVYLPTGAVFAARYDVVMKNNSMQGSDHRGLVRDYESSIDIDDLWDFRVAEMILQDRMLA